MGSEIVQRRLVHSYVHVYITDLVFRKGPVACLSLFSVIELDKSLYFNLEFFC